MSEVDFFEFMNERHAIHHCRKDGRPWPWTDDEIFKRYKFCNVFRQLDRGTSYWIKVCKKNAPLGETVFNTALYRLFNLPATWELMGKWHNQWDLRSRKRYAKLLATAREHKIRVWSDAYMITGTRAAGRAKHDMAFEAVTEIWLHRREIADLIRQQGETLEAVTKTLSPFPAFGRFLAYEVACDLMHTKRIKAPDHLTWANAGPGAKRGLNRVHGRQLKHPLRPNLSLAEMRSLLANSANHWKFKKEPLDLRCIEHSLCEFDKYQRLLNKQGVGRRYRPCE